MKISLLGRSFSDVMVIGEPKVGLFIEPQMQYYHRIETDAFPHVLEIRVDFALQEVENNFSILIATVGRHKLASLISTFECYNIHKDMLVNLENYLKIINNNYLKNQKVPIPTFEDFMEIILSSPVLPKVLLQN